MKKIFLILLLSHFILSAKADNCQIDWCAHGNLSSIEKQICTDATLRAADVFMNQTYKELMVYRGKENHEGHWPDVVRDEQKRWLKKRNQLSNKAALLNVYMQRIQTLHQWLRQHNNRSN